MKIKHKKLLQIFSVVILSYVLSYFILSRSSMYINNKIYLNWGKGFYCIPCDEKYFIDNKPLQITHIVLFTFYYPVWWIDHNLLNGPDKTHFPENIELQTSIGTGLAQEAQNC